MNGSGAEAAFEGCKALLAAALPIRRGVAYWKHTMEAGRLRIGGRGGAGGGATQSVIPTNQRSGRTDTGVGGLGVSRLDADFRRAYIPNRTPSRGSGI